MAAELLEFGVIWEQCGRDRLPYPLQYRSAAEAAGDFGRERAAAARRMQAVLDDDLYRVFATLAETDSWVAAFGIDEIGRPEECVVRAHAGIAGKYAAILAQEPGTDADCGGTVVITLADAEDAADELAAALPSRNPGRQQGFSVHESKLRRNAGDSMLSDPRTTPARERVSRFLKRPHTSAGEVVAAVGVAIDARPPRDLQGFRWVDFAGDGRYLTRKTATLTVEPATRDVVAEWIRATVQSGPRAAAR